MANGATANGTMAQGTMTNSKKRNKGHAVMRSVMLLLNVAFYGSALAGTVMLVHDLPQSAPAAAAPHTAPAAPPQTIPSMEQAQIAVLQNATLQNVRAIRHLSVTYVLR